jgi:hypothetical protein
MHHLVQQYVGHPDVVVVRGCGAVVDRQGVLQNAYERASESDRERERERERERDLLQMQRGAQPVGSHKHRSFAHCNKCQLFAPTTHHLRHNDLSA